jgi:hypothetical protein
MEHLMHMRILAYSVCDLNGLPSQYCILKVKSKFYEKALAVKRLELYCLHRIAFDEKLSPT